MGRSARHFTEAEDAMIRANMDHTGLSLKTLARELKAAVQTVRRRKIELLALDAGIEPPPYVQNNEGRFMDLSTPPITVGEDDPLLKRLRKVHGKKPS